MELLNETIRAGAHGIFSNRINYEIDVQYEDITLSASGGGGVRVIYPTDTAEGREEAAKMLGLAILHNAAHDHQAEVASNAGASDFDLREAAEIVAITHDQLAEDLQHGHPAATVTTLLDLTG